MESTAAAPPSLHCLSLILLLHIDQTPLQHRLSFKKELTLRTKMPAKRPILKSRGASKASEDAPTSTTEDASAAEAEGEGGGGGSEDVTLAMWGGSPARYVENTIIEYAFFCLVLLQAHLSKNV